MCVLGRPFSGAAGILKQALFVHFTLIFFPREGVIQGVGELCDLCWKSIAHKLSVCVGQEMALCIVCVIVTDVA